MLAVSQPFQFPSASMSNHSMRVTHHSYEQKIGDKYSISSRVLGTGTKSIVKLGYSHILKRNVAIKVVDKSISPKEKLLFETESKILEKVAQLNSKQYVSYLETLEDDRNIYIIMELINGVELIDFYKGRISELLTKKIFKQIVHSVEKLHQNHICHLDLKLENVMYIRYLNQTILIDFGFSNTTIKLGVNEIAETIEPINDIKQTHYCGTLHYSAPEILKEIPYDGKKADSWSLGVMLYCMLALCYPFDIEEEVENSATNSPSYFSLVAEKIINDELNCDKISSNEARSLINSLLAKDPADRIYVHEILNHPWFL